MTIAHKKSLKNLFLIFTLVLIAVTWCGIGESALASYGYEVIIEDDANLLTDEEEASLEELMQEITVYGNAAFKTIDENDWSTKGYIEDYYETIFGSSSGTVFLIDMDNRNIQIYSDGAIYNIITDSYGDTITDNVYTYASDAEYYECAYKAFQQILSLLQGNKIAQPMKYISNTFLAIILALLVNYFVVKIMSVARKPSEKQLLEATKNGFRFENPEVTFTHETKRYDPPSSSSSGGGGGGGGGHSGGGGGGHSF